MLQHKIHGLDVQEHLPTLLAADALELAHQLQQHQKKIFPPQMQKTLRLFSPAEAAAFIGIGEGYLRQIASEGHGPSRCQTGGACMRSPISSAFVVFWTKVASRANTYRIVAVTRDCKSSRS